MNTFNHQLYLLLYPDLGEHQITTQGKAYEHWVNNGKNEMRISSIDKFIQEYNFDCSFYRKYYNLKIKDEEELVFHWLKIGKQQGYIYNKKKKEEKSVTAVNESMKELSKNSKSENKKHFFNIDNFYIKQPYFEINTKRDYLSCLPNQKEQITIFKIKDSTDTCKGINIDQDIISRALFSLKFSNQIVKLIYEQDFHWMSYNVTKRDYGISLKSHIYIFSEIILFDLCQYLLKNDKKVIIIPNIDSYDSFSPARNWFHNLKILGEDPNFYIWSKTRQIYDWINKLGIKKNVYLNFIFYKELLREDFLINNNEQKKTILLDTGSSLTDRKYVTEIASIFHRFEVGFKLVIKTVPSVYKKKKLHLYENSVNIRIVNKLMTLPELDKFYEGFDYMIYLSKFDGLGLSLSKAMTNNMFIFTGDGLPWNEIVKYYPRKCLIHMEQDFSKSVGHSKKGFARSQIYYKCDFTDLINKLRVNSYEKNINQKKKETIFFNWLNKHIFLSNLYYSLNTESYYNKTCVYMCSYNERSIILLENLVSILFQTKHINIYLNSSHKYSYYFLKKINNINLIPFYRDMKALSKLYCLGKSKTNCTYNFILDDDIIYPLNYLIDTARLINNQENSNAVYSYNGFMDKYKLSFMKKHHPKLNNKSLNVIGTGTIFYKGPHLIDKHKILKSLKNINSQEIIFADKFLSEFLDKEGIDKRYYNCPQYNWMTNNSKICLNDIPGLYEYKIQHNLINQEFLSTQMNENISIVSVLYYVQNTKEEELNKIMNKSKLIKLSSFIHVKLIYEVNDLRIRFPSYDYLITDTLENIQNNKSLVYINSLKNNNFEQKMTLNDFLKTL